MQILSKFCYNKHLTRSMAPRTINTTVAYGQLHKRVIIQQCYIYKNNTCSQSQNIINAKANKYQQNHSPISFARLVRPMNVLQHCR